MTAASKSVAPEHHICQSCIQTVTKRQLNRGLTPTERSFCFRAGRIKCLAHFFFTARNLHAATTTTGGSLLQAIERAEAAGLQVVQCLTVVDREEGAAQALADAGYTLQALTTRTELLG